MSLAMLAMGSNLAPRLTYLRHGYAALKQLGSIDAVAPIYESAPYGILSQPRFLNTAVSLKTKLPPEKLLIEIKKIEQHIGRIPRQRWGPRELDIDIIFYEREVIRQTGLQIPHPEYQKRGFVLQPLADIAPDFLPPDAADNLKQLVKQCPEGASLQLIETNWTADGTEL